MDSDARFQGMGLDHLPQGFAAQRAPGARDKHASHAGIFYPSRPNRFQVLFEQVRRAGGKGHDSFLSPLPDAAQVARVKMEVVQRQPRQFGDAQPGRVKRLQDGPVAHGRGAVPRAGCEQAVHFPRRKGVRQHFPEPGRVHRLGYVPAKQALLLEVAEKDADGNEHARHAVGAQAPLFLGKQEIENLLARDGIERRGLFRLQVPDKCAQVLRVCATGVWAEPALKGYVIQELIYQ